MLGSSNTTWVGALQNRYPVGKRPLKSARIKRTAIDHGTTRLHDARYGIPTCEPVRVLCIGAIKSLQVVETRGFLKFMLCYRHRDRRRSSRAYRDARFISIVRKTGRTAEIDTGFIIVLEIRAESSPSVIRVSQNDRL